MMGGYNSSLFGLQPDPMGLTPQIGLPGAYPGAAPVAPTPFIWGGAGDRLTDADIAQREAADRQMMAAGMDTSPIGSWTQGAARVAQALVAKLDKKKTDAASAANVQAGKDALAGLSQPSANEQTIVSILADPTLPQGLQDYAKLKLAALNKAPPAPNEFERALIASGVSPGTPEWQAANVQRVAAINDPTMTASLPGGGVYVGPRSQFQATIAGGGGPASTAGSVAPPATLPPDFDFGTGGPTPPASGTFPDPMKAPGTMTSGRRTVEGNRLVGGVPNSHHLDGDAADYANTSVAALRAYFGNGARYLNEGNHIHVTLPGYGRVPYFGARGTAGL